MTTFLSYLLVLRSLINELLLIGYGPSTSLLRSVASERLFRECANYRSSKFAKYRSAKWKGLSDVEGVSVEWHWWRTVCGASSMNLNVIQARVKLRSTRIVSRRDRALAIVVLAVEPLLLYLIGDPEDPATNWRASFKRKLGPTSWSWGESYIVKDGESVHEHIKTMTEIFEVLAVIGDSVA